MAAQSNTPVCTANWIGMDAALSLKTHLNLAGISRLSDKLTYIVILLIIYMFIDKCQDKNKPNKWMIL
jgi:hypothetical protein